MYMSVLACMCLNASMHRYICMSEYFFQKHLSTLVKNLCVHKFALEYMNSSDGSGIRSSWHHPYFEHVHILFHEKHSVLVPDIYIDEVFLK